MSTQHKMSKTIAMMLTAGALVAAQQANAVPDQPKEWEKCSGVAKKAQNDCGALDGSHGCAGKAESDNMAEEWVYVPKGTCEKLTGGIVRKVKPAKS